MSGPRELLDQLDAATTTPAALREHRVHGFNGTQVACSCDRRRWMGRDEHLDHLFGVLHVPELVARLRAVEELAHRLERPGSQAGRYLADLIHAALDGSQ